MSIHIPVWLLKYFNSCLQTMEINFKKGEVQQLCNLTFQLHYAYLGGLNSHTNYVTRDKLIFMDDYCLRIPPLKKHIPTSTTFRRMQEIYCFAEILQISTLIPASLPEKSDWKLCTIKKNRIFRSCSTNSLNYIYNVLIFCRTLQR